MRQQTAKADAELLPARFNTLPFFPSGHFQFETIFHLKFAFDEVTNGYVLIQIVAKQVLCYMIYLLEPLFTGETGITTYRTLGV